MSPRASLVEVVAALAGRYPIPTLPADPFQLILWENIGYLVDDERRRRLFDAFEAQVGLDPQAILGADPALLLRLAQAGGMRPETRVDRWRAIADIGTETLDFAASLRGLPLKAARTQLKRFPTIADPGADKILLLSGVAAVPALDSNGLRALARLGFFAEAPSYDRSYKAAIAVLRNQVTAKM